MEGARSCTVITRCPLYRESALRKAKICRLVLGVLKFSVSVFVFLLSLFFTQSLRNYCSRGSQNCSPSHKNRNQFEWKNVIRKSVIHPNLMLCAEFIYFSCTVLLLSPCLPRLSARLITHKFVYTCSA